MGGSYGDNSASTTQHTGVNSGQMTGFKGKRQRFLNLSKGNNTEKTFTAGKGRGKPEEEKSDYMKIKTAVHRVGTAKCILEGTCIMLTARK